MLHRKFVDCGTHLKRYWNFRARPILPQHAPQFLAAIKEACARAEIYDECKCLSVILLPSRICTDMNDITALMIPGNTTRD